jgi:hypothetical protein
MEQKNSKFNFHTVFLLVSFILVGILLFATMFVRNKSINDERASLTYSADKNVAVSKTAYYGKEAINSVSSDIFDEAGNKIDFSALTEETTLYNKAGELINLPTISPDEYSQVKEGMSYEEVCALIGGEGKKLSEIDSPGDEFYTVCYFFYGDKAETSASFIFQGNRLKSKANTGIEEK